MNFVTYKENETVDNDANYFLMLIDTKDSQAPEDFEELAIKIDNSLVSDAVEQDSENFPLFCFENGNVDSVEDLNLNILKKFSHSCAQKYILVSLQNTSRKGIGYLKNKSFDDWHDPNTQVKLSFVKGSEYDYSGKLLKIFHKNYQPTINNLST